MAHEHEGNMVNEFDMDEDGEPCGHPGCLRHITHPCEKCGRVGGQMGKILPCPICHGIPEQYTDDVSKDTNYECCSASITGLSRWNQYSAAIELALSTVEFSEKVNPVLNRHRAAHDI